MKQELFEAKGFCKFCDQGRMIKAPAGANEDELNELATMECTCDKAKHYQNKENKKKQCFDWIENRWSQDEETKRLFIQAACNIIEYKAKQVTIVKGEWKHAIDMNNDGLLTIKSSKKVDEEVSF